ncbi:hypothetical protein [Vibrio phage vB_VpaS_CHI]|nr:hypothetical protein [Vibrio phage vB_VpaS_ALK]USL90085.1 hypothetical protein [Vibrio phage vB_VpaS_CHI]
MLLLRIFKLPYWAASWGKLNIFNVLRQILIDVM